MFFTNEDYKKIENWLRTNAVKDSDFSDATIPLIGNEFIPIVQGDNNHKLPVNILLKQLSLLTYDDIINITDNYGVASVTLEKAIEFIPVASRKIGQLITFFDEKNGWKIYQFQGTTLSQWGLMHFWKDIFQFIPEDELNKLFSKIEELSKQLDNKVDKNPGKGLSTNDFTDEYKNRLDSLDGNYANLNGNINEDFSGNTFIAKTNYILNRNNTPIKLFEDNSNKINKELVATITYLEKTETELQLDIIGNYFYNCTNIAPTSITLNSLPASPDDIYECIIIFNSGDTAPTLSIPKTLKKAGDWNLFPNLTYEISIRNGLAIICYYE